MDFCYYIELLRIIELEGGDSAKSVTQQRTMQLSLLSIVLIVLTPHAFRKEAPHICIFEAVDEQSVIGFRPERLFTA